MRAMNPISEGTISTWPNVAECGRIMSEGFETINVEKEIQGIRKEVRQAIERRGS